MRPTFAYERERPTITIPPELVIIQDTREQKPIFKISDVVIDKGLKTGDYSIVGFEDKVTIERKSVPDLYGSVKRDRFEREITRMKKMEWAGLLIEGPESEVMKKQMFGKVTPKQVYGALTSYEIQGIHIYYAGDEQDAQDWILSRLVKFWDHYRRAKEGMMRNKKRGRKDYG